MTGWGGLALSCALLLGCRGEEVESVATEAGVDAVPSETSVDAGFSELLTNPGFELGGAGWTGDSVEESSTAHGGAKSVRVCAKPGADIYFFGQENEGAWLVPGTRVYGEFWVRAPDNDAGSAPDLMMRFEQMNAAGDSIDLRDQGGVALDTSWKRVSAIVTVVEGAKRLRWVLWSHGAGTCVLVDDASMHVLR